MEYVNQVELVGRVSGREEPRVLPSGDAVTTVRVVVPRPAAPGDDRTHVDTIDVACWSARTRRVADSLAAGEVVAVSGALRRRFFRAAGGVGSRYEVEAARLVRRRMPPGAARG
ncbi:MAG TPA: single-stranded DNA-binding protein [Dermatophilaceae bacterium]|nr:single-stranded DNA-binding protein [Dermatophilaceae bacterium]